MTNYKHTGGRCCCYGCYMAEEDEKYFKSFSKKEVLK